MSHVIVFIAVTSLHNYHKYVYSYNNSYLPQSFPSTPVARSIHSSPKTVPFLSHSSPTTVFHSSLIPAPQLCSIPLSFQPHNCVPFLSHFSPKTVPFLSHSSPKTVFHSSLIPAPELCSRRDHLDVVREQSCGRQAYSISPADVFQDSQGQGKALWPGPDHLPHGKTLRGDTSCE